MIPGRIAVVGILTDDLFFRSPRLPGPGETVIGSGFDRGPGGKGANQAAAAARMGADVWPVFAIGQDDAGARGAELLRGCGASVEELLRRTDLPTATAAIMVAADGGNQIVVCPGAGMSLTAAETAEALERIDPEWVMLQCEAPLETMSAAAGRRILLNPAPAGPISPEILMQAALIVPNEVEAAQLTGLSVEGPSDALAACQALREMGPAAAVVTIGRLGCVWQSPEGEGWIAPPKVQAVDTTAAGDCFAGALAAGLARGESLPAALRLAVAASSISVERAGAMASMPTLAEAEARRPLTQEKSLFS